MSITALFLTAPLSLLAGLAYRLGGIGDPFPTKTRDWGVPLIMGFQMWLLGLWHWSLIPSALLLWAALSTYNKWLGKLLGLGTEDVFGPSWFITGVFYGLAMTPYAYFTDTWILLGIRSFILGLLTYLWSVNIDEVNLEEGGRGALIILTNLVFVVG